MRYKWNMAIIMAAFMFGFAHAQEPTSDKALDATVQSRWPKIQKCYEQELVRGNISQGVVEIGFKTNDRGRVISSWVESTTLANEIVERCAALEFRKLKFRLRGKDPIKGIYPLRFNLHQDTQKPQIPQRVLEASIEQALEDKWPKFRKCYLKEKMRDTTLGEGQIIVHFMISERGQIDQAVVKKTTLNNLNVEDCVTDEFEDIRLGQRLGHPINGNYPITFKVKP